MFLNLYSLRGTRWKEGYGVNGESRFIGTSPFQPRTPQGRKQGQRLSEITVLVYDSKQRRLSIGNSCGFRKGFIVESICLSIPFMVLSTKVDRTGETEKRYLTPFGTIDVTFRKVLDWEKQKTNLEIDVCGDAECWVSHNSAITEFRTALLHLVWGLAKEHLVEEAQFCFDEVKMHVC